MNTKKQNTKSLEDIHRRLSVPVSLEELTGKRNKSDFFSSETSVSSLITDSRRVIPGSAFFAIPGLRSDGEEFIDEAIDREID